MLFTVKVPDFGQIINNVTVVKIHKKVGDYITTNDTVVDIETEKVTLEIKSHYNGVINKILVKEDDKISIGQDIFTVDIKTDQDTEKTDNKVEKVKISKLRKTMSQRLKYIQNNAAIVTTFNEIDMTNIIKKRNEYKNNKIEVGLMPFFIKAVASILPDFPGVNAQIEEDYIIYKKYYNIGFAIDIENGLFISVVKDANKMNIADITKTMKNLVKNAKKNLFIAEDSEHGTFTITNGGVYGSLFSTPIINPPQSGILGINAIIERPIALNGNVVIKPMMYVSLSYDHRIIDGKEAIGFLNALKHFLQNYK